MTSSRNEESGEEGTSKQTLLSGFGTDVDNLRCDAGIRSRLQTIGIKLKTTTDDQCLTIVWDPSYYNKIITFQRGINSLPFRCQDTGTNVC